MNFVNTHPELIGKHAFLGASKHAWLNYDDEKLRAAYINSFSAQIGTLVHEYSKKRIERRIPIENDKGEQTALLMHLLDGDIPMQAIQLDVLFFNMMPYVNDAIGYKMTPEVLLYYSDYAFGWADTISYSRNLLRIHDLKTGLGPVSMDQLMVYAGFFYLQHKKEANLQKSRTELRIYQNQEVVVHTPTNHEISGIMDKIIHGDMVVDNLIVEG